MPVWDIETGPRLDIDLASLAEPFDESSVKVGNLKDPDKIAAKIAEARAEHEASTVGRAALSPATGCVLAIGVASSRGSLCMAVEDSDDHAAAESNLLSGWWERVNAWRQSGRKLVGHHLSFDLPFVIRRSWILGVPVPGWILAGRYRPDIFVDTEERWLSFNRFGSEKSNLDMISKAFGLAGKYKPSPMVLPGEQSPTELSGATFHRYFRAGGEHRTLALEYLAQDLSMTREVAIRMGIELD
jgi:hypothetical protein